MLRKLFKATRPVPTEALPDATTTPAQRLSATGDIHARDDLLAQLLGLIDEDNAARGPSETSLIFLGDLIDRGPDSAKGIERLIDLKKHHPRTRFLLGNHEEVFLQALRGESVGALRYSLRIGGDATVMSYGLTEQEYRRASFEELFRIVRERVPPEALAVLERFEAMVV